MYIKLETRITIQCAPENTLAYAFDDKITKSQPILTKYAGNNAD